MNPEVVLYELEISCLHHRPRNSAELNDVRNTVEIDVLYPFLNHLRSPFAERRSVDFLQGKEVRCSCSYFHNAIKRRLLHCLFLLLGVVVDSENAAILSQYRCLIEIRNDVDNGGVRALLIFGVFDALLCVTC